jgi:hypothetical protein
LEGCVEASDDEGWEVTGQSRRCPEFRWGPALFCASCTCARWRCTEVQLRHLRQHVHTAAALRLCLPHGGLSLEHVSTCGRRVWCLRGQRAAAPWGGALTGSLPARGLDLKGNGASSPTSEALTASQAHACSSTPFAGARACAALRMCLCLRGRLHGQRRSCCWRGGHPTAQLLRR